MKRIIASVLFIAMVATGVSAIEYGGLLDSNSSFEKIAENDFAFSQKLDASAYMRIPFTKDGRAALSPESSPAEGELQGGRWKWIHGYCCRPVYHV